MNEKKNFKKVKMAIIVLLLLIVTAGLSFVLKNTEVQKIAGKRNELLASTDVARKTAVKETAEAYYRKGSDVQYCTYRKVYEECEPEYADVDNKAFFVCSSFVYNVYKNAMDIELPPSTQGLMKMAYTYKNDNKYVPLYFDALNQNSNSLYAQADYSGIDKFIANVAKQLQVGDVLVYITEALNEDNEDETNPKGHVVLVTEQIKDNSGNIIDARIIHAIGNNFSENSTTDALENGTDNGVKKEKFSDYFTQDWLRHKYQFAVIRPLGGGTERLVPYYKKNSNFSTGYELLIKKEAYDGNTTDYGSTRVNFPGLDVKRTSDKHNQVVEAGATITYKIVVSNNGTNNYTQNLVIEDEFPEQAEIANAGGGNVEGNKITWNIGNLAANTSVEKTYSITLSNELSQGDVITTAGTVSNQAGTLFLSIPTASNLIGFKLSSTDQSKINTQVNALIDSSDKKGVEFVNEVYKQAFGVDSVINLNGKKLTDIIDEEKIIDDETEVGEKLELFAANGNYGRVDYTKSIVERTKENVFDNLTSTGATTFAREWDQ